MERKFLMYLIYIFLPAVRMKSLETGDSRLFHLSDLLHNIPFMLEDDERAKVAYEEVIEAVKHLKIEGWLANRQTEFYERHPEARIYFNQS